MSYWERNEPSTRPQPSAPAPERSPERPPQPPIGASDPAVEKAPQPSTTGEGAGSEPVRAASGAPKSAGAMVAALLVGLILGVGGATLFSEVTGEDDVFAGAVDESRYQAVILSNDKVYFGRIRAKTSEFYELRNAFFLRETREGDDGEPVRALLPVNREIHAPENTMLIRRDEVVLIENLAEDSPLLKEIARQRG